MRFRSILCVVCLWAGLPALAEITSIGVEGVTSTQAIVSYTAPDTSPCTLEVSESPEYAPLAHDVNPGLFPGANSDDRPGNITAGTRRVFVIGKRAADLAADGRRYSRALQAYTTHYFRITCGADSATGSFQTTTIPLGNTYADILPPDPANLTYSHAGRYAWPSIDWNDPQQKIVDPQTGVLIRRATKPRERTTGLANQAFSAAVDLDQVWTNPSPQAAVTDNDGLAATFPGTCPPGQNCYLYLRAARLALNGDTYPGEWYQPDFFQLTLKASCSGTCEGEDSKIQVCLTANGISCYGGYIEQALAAGERSYVLPANPAPVLGDWLLPGQPALPRQEMYARSGTVSVAGSRMAWSSGSLFNPYWSGGSTIRLAGPSDDACTAGQEFAIDRVETARSLMLRSPAAADGVYRYCAPAFGVLIRKKTSSSDAVSIQYARFSLEMTYEGTWPDGGFTDVCATKLSLDGNGNPGYHCMFGYGFYWVSRDTGESRFLGNLGTGVQQAPDSSKGVYDASDGWKNQSCAAESATFDPADPDVFYCSVKDNATPGRTIILRGRYTGRNEQVPGGRIFSAMPNVEWRNLTPGSQGRDLNSQIAAVNNEFDAAKFACSVIGIQDRYLLIKCLRGSQDTIGWSAALQVGNGLPLSEGGDSRVVAASSTYSRLPARWCGMHAMFVVGDLPWINWTAQNRATGSSAVGTGPWRVQLTGAPLSGNPGDLEFCPDTSFDPAVRGRRQCTTIEVDGEPCDRDPGAGEAGGCPQNPAWGYVQSAEPGDMLTVDSEAVRIQAKLDSRHWIVERSFGGRALAAHSSGSLLTENCTAGTAGRDKAQFIGSIWWNFVDDPRGLNGSGVSVWDDAIYQLGHRVFRGDTYIEASSNGYRIRRGAIPTTLSQPADLVVSINPPFAGATGFGNTGSVEAHSSFSQVAASDQEKQWTLDGRPFLHAATTPQTALVNGAPEAVSGTLFRFVSAPRGRAPNWVTLDRKLMPTMASCGAQPLADISGPASAIQDGPADNYKYCYVYRDGECQAGSRAGEVYVNCPYIAAGGAGCSNAAGGSDICLANLSSYVGVLAQVGIAAADPAGRLGRNLTHALSRWRMFDPYWNARALPDASWMLAPVPMLGGAREEVVAIKLPPYPNPDGVDRSDFVPVPLMVTPPAEMGVDNAVIEFGYAENGDPSNMYCTTRQEACVKGSQPGNNYGFAGDDTRGVPCAASCTVSVPGIPQRVLYFRVKYRDTGNNVLAVSSPLAVAVP